MPDEFSKTTVRKFGARGDMAYEQEEKTTDLDGLEERIEEVGVSFCTCGSRIMIDSAEEFRCVECEQLCCNSCRIEHSRYNYCPVCAERAFGLDKRTFLSMLFLDHGLLAPDELVDVTTLGGEVVEITFDTTADTLVDHDYLADDGRLSPAGKEALHIGKAIYGDDGDVQTVMKQIRVQEVVTQ